MNIQGDNRYKFENLDGGWLPYGDYVDVADENNNNGVVIMQVGVSAHYNVPYIDMTILSEIDDKPVAEAKRMLL